MSTKFYQEGNNLDIVAAAAIASDDVVVSGDIVGIAQQDLAIGELGVIGVEGVWGPVAKVTGEEWVVGDKLGWDSSASAFDKTFTAATGDVTDCAVAAVAAASADAVGYVKLTPGAGSIN